MSIASCTETIYVWLLFVDDEKELNAKDIEWSKHNLPVSETDKDRTENDAEANAEPLTKEKPRKGMYVRSL